MPATPLRSMPRPNEPPMSSTDRPTQATRPASLRCALSDLHAEVFRTPDRPPVTARKISVPRPGHRRLKSVMRTDNLHARGPDSQDEITAAMCVGGPTPTQACCLRAGTRASAAAPAEDGAAASLA